MSRKVSKLLPLLEAICTGGDGGTLPPVAQLTVFATEIQTSLSSSVLVFCIMTR